MGPIPSSRLTPHSVVLKINFPILHGLRCGLPSDLDPQERRVYRLLAETSALHMLHRVHPPLALGSRCALFELDDALLYSHMQLVHCTRGQGNDHVMATLQPLCSARGTAVPTYHSLFRHASLCGCVCRRARARMRETAGKAAQAVGMTDLCTCLSMRIYACVHVCMHAYICMYICVYACIHVYMHICMRVYLHTHI